MFEFYFKEKRGGTHLFEFPPFDYSYRIYFITSSALKHLVSLSTA